MKKTASVDQYISNNSQWGESLKILRSVILDLHLEENIKWGAPIYSLQNKNVVGIAAFKNYVGLWFFQGALLKDPFGKLINAQEGVTKALRQWRFSSLEEVQNELSNIKVYLEEAILNQKNGKEIKPNRKKELILPPELTQLFDSNDNVHKRFEALPLTKKREFSDYITEAKRTETKLKRLDKIVPMILKGEGLNDKYR